MATVGVIDLSKTVAVSEAAEIANVHEETVRRWCRSGRLSAQKVGRCLVINLAELRELLRGNDL